MKQRNTGAHAGFTLVELMMVVAIIGLLAAVAIPSFGNYMRKARTTEAALTVDKMVMGATVYYETDHADSNGTYAPKQFPGPLSCSGNPPSDDPCINVEGGPGGLECGCQAGAKCPGNTADWSGPTWVAMGFSRPDPHSYRAMYGRIGTGEGSEFHALAVGDLDCDGTRSKFERVGIVTDGTVSMGGVRIDRELE